MGTATVQMRNSQMSDLECYFRHEIVGQSQNMQRQNPKNLATEGKNSQKQLRDSQLKCSEKQRGRDAIISCAISKLETSIQVKWPNQWLVEPLFFGQAPYRGGPGPRPSFHGSPTMPLCWPLYICWSAPNTKASRHPILLAWFKEEKKALLLPWVIPGQASQEHPVGGYCSKGASCSQLEVPQPLQTYIVHLPRPRFAMVQPPFQELNQGLPD